MIRKFGKQFIIILFCFSFLVSCSGPERGESPVSFGLKIPNQKVIEGMDFSYFIELSRDVTGFDLEDTYTMAITNDGGTGITYNSTTGELAGAIASLEAGTYRIEGSITSTIDPLSTTDWSFVITIQDITSPILTIAEQTVSKGAEFSYAVIEVVDISNLRRGESYTITLTDDGGSGITYGRSSNTFSGGTASLASPATYTLRGRIADEYNNSSDWSFNLVLQDEVIFGLNIRAQEINEGENFSYLIDKTRDTFGFDTEEAYTISITSDGRTGITYHSGAGELTGEIASLEVGVYRVEGSITSLADPTRTGDWFFIVIIQDITAPILTIPEQVVLKGNEFSYAITIASDISDLKEGEPHTITLTDNGGSGITYDRSSNTFSGSTASLASPATYTLRGRIVDEYNNSSNWSFNLVLQDEVIFGLNIRAQEINEGENFSYLLDKARDIINFNAQETYTIVITNNGGTGITYNSTTGELTGQASSLSFGTYRVEGTITNAIPPERTREWFFNLSVLDITPPTLDIVEMIANKGEPFSYIITDTNDISNLRSGESYNIIVVDDGGAGITYDSSTKTFSGGTDSLTAPRSYIIQGNIVDGHRNSSRWEFNLVVQNQSDSDISLRIPDQVTQKGEGIFYYRYEIKDSNLVGFDKGDSYVLDITDYGGARGLFTKKTFWINVHNTPAGNYTLRGTLKDSSTSVKMSDWSFNIEILPLTKIRLFLSDQYVQVGDCFSYTIGSENISGIPPGKTPIIHIESHDSSNVFFHNNTFSSPTTLFGKYPGTADPYRIYGTISDGSTAVSQWAFDLRALDTIAPTLSLPDITINHGETFSYTVKDSDISNVREWEDRIDIKILNNGGSGVTYRSKIFSSAPVVVLPGVYIIKGTIKDPSGNSRKWSFKLTVRPGGSALKVTNIAKTGNTWSWDCSASSCSYRYIFSETVPEKFTESSFTMNYGSSSSVTEPAGTGFLYIQARDSSNNQSLISYTPYGRLSKIAVKQIVTGLFHNCALLETGNVKCWGRNNFGQLGQDHARYSERNRPVSVNLGDNLSVEALSAGSGFTCALLVAGDGAKQVKCWGNNASGQLGQGHTNNLGDGANEMGANLPAINLGVGRTPQAIATGSSHACALLDNGKVKCWGSNSFGELGQGHTGDIGDGVGEMAALSEINLGIGATVKDIAAGGGNVCVILGDDQVKCWGKGNHGQLGQGNSNHIGNQAGEVAALSAINLGANAIAKSLFVGDGHACAILNNDDIKCWGSDQRGGQGPHWGDDAGEIASSPPIVNLGSDALGIKLLARTITGLEAHTCATLNNRAGKCWPRGNEHRGNSLPVFLVGLGRSVEEIGKGLLHTCIVLDRGEVQCWGNNYYGQLGRSGQYETDMGTVDFGDRPTDQPPHSNDSTPLILSLSPQTLESGNNFSYQVMDSDIIGLRSGETYSIAVTSYDGTNISYNATSKTLAGQTSSLSEGTYTIRGTITDGHSNVSHWSMRLDIRDVSAPTLQIADQTVLRGKQFSYTVNRSQDISDLETGEDYTLGIIDDGGTEIEVHSTESGQVFRTNTNALSEASYTIRGWIANENNNFSEWSFVLIIEDGMLPLLNIADQAVELESPFNYTIDHGNDILGLGASDGYTINITDGDGSGLTYNATSKIFSAEASALEERNYNIRGTITSSADTTKTSNWGLTLVVRDTIAPNLLISQQAVLKRQSFSYTIDEANDILNLRQGESYTIKITDNAGTRITYNNNTRTLEGMTQSLSPGIYTIEGKIADGNGNERGWFFNFIVKNEDTLYLRISKIQVNRGDNFSYTLNENKNVRNLESEESYTISITSDDETNMVYSDDGTSKTFSGTTANLAIGDYNITGMITSTVDSARWSHWSFSISIIRPDTTPPRISDLRKEGTAGWRWNCSEPCTYRYLFTETPPDSFDKDLFIMDYEDRNLAEITLVEPYYIYVQARDEVGNESSVIASRHDGVERPATDIAVGANHACAIFDTGTVKCWGKKDDGRLGIPGTGEQLEPVSVDLGSGLTPEALALGERHSCALLSNGSGVKQMKCWGRNKYGQLGQGHKRSLGDDEGEMGASLRLIDLGTGRTPKVIAAGFEHTCAVLDNDQVKCWGRGSSGWGRLGTGGSRNRGDGAEEMGNNLPAINLGEGETAKSVVAGALNTCVILNTDEVKCWGGGFSGVNGQGNANVVGTGPGDVAALSEIDLGANLTAQKVVMGNFHVCATLNDNTAKCWGENGKGQLGQSHSQDLGDGPGEMGDDLSAIDLGVDSSDNPRTVLDLVTGNRHVCAILSSGKTTCWGSNDQRQLGRDDTRLILGDSEDEMGNNLYSVNLQTNVAPLKLASFTTAHFTCAILHDGRVKCWGYGGNGQLARDYDTDLQDGFSAVRFGIEPIWIIP